MNTYFILRLRKICLLLTILSGFIICSGQAQEATQEMAVLRQEMVETKIKSKGIEADILEAILIVERHLFVPEYLWSMAYEDIPLPIGENQFMVEPSIIALIAQTLELEGSEQVLVVGTGSGYLCAILSYLADTIYTTELNGLLLNKAQNIFDTLDMGNIQMRLSDGYFGWEEAAPFDCIIINGAVDHIPPPLLNQLKIGGRLILPMGDPYGFQNLVIVIKQPGNLDIQSIMQVIFNPLLGQALVP